MDAKADEWGLVWDIDAEDRSALLRAFSLTKRKAQSEQLPPLSLSCLDFCLSHMSARKGKGVDQISPPRRSKAPRRRPAAFHSALAFH